MRIKPITTRQLKSEVKRQLYPRLMSLGYSWSPLPEHYTSDPTAKGLCDEYMHGHWFKVARDSTHVIDIHFDCRSRATFHITGAKILRHAECNHSQNSRTSGVLAIQAASYYRLTSSRLRYRPFGVRGRKYKRLTALSLVADASEKIGRLTSAIDADAGDCPFVFYVGPLRTLRIARQAIAATLFAITTSALLNVSSLLKGSLYAWLSDTTTNPIMLYASISYFTAMRIFRW